ncbi:MAG: deaminase [Patescibacteria group bacterium]
MALLLYIPVLHRGYLDLFERRKNEKELLVIGESLIAEFSQLSRELRRIDPGVMAKMIGGMGIFQSVKVVEKADLKKLAGKKIVSADEVEMKALLEKYLPANKVVFDTSFLRWDAKKIQKIESVSPDVEMTSDKLAKQLMKLAENEAKKSADWFRQVGAVLWTDGKILAASYNQRQPTPYEAYAVDDPRNHLEAGTDTHLRQTIHAEQAILVRAAKEGFSVKGASLYVTTFPCPDCAALIAESGIKECYFQEGYSKIGGADLLKSASVKIVRVVLKKKPLGSQA